MLFGNSQRTKTSAEEAVRDGDLAKAITQFQKVVKKNPDDLQSRKRLADLFRRIDDVPEAIAQYEVVASAYADQGLMLRAIASCRSILELDPENEAANRTLETSMRSGTKPTRLPSRKKKAGPPSSRTRVMRKSSPAAMCSSRVSTTATSTLWQTTLLPPPADSPPHLIGSPPTLAGQ